jgi:D-amino-acid dehydrogenase
MEQSSGRGGSGVQKIIVIGGGIVGASAAYQAIQTGAEVTLVDRADTGHATAAGAGIVCAATTRDRPGAWYPLAFRAVAFYADLLHRLADDGETETGYEVVGGLFVALDEADHPRLDDVHRLLEQRTRAGVQNIGDITRLSTEETHALFPALSREATAIHLSGAARVNGRLLRESIQRAARKRGAQMVRGTAEIIVEGRSVMGVRVEGATLPADAVIVAAGAWSQATTAALGVSIPVYPQRGQILHLELPGAHAEQWPIVTGFLSHYMLTFPGSRIVAGATREDHAGFDYRVTAAGQQELLNEALKVAPGLADGTILETRVGFRPMSPDGLPILGSIEGVEGAYVATGMGPSGLMMGPFAGALVADLAQGRSTPLDSSPYDPLRFARVTTGV